MTYGLVLVFAPGFGIPEYDEVNRNLGFDPVTGENYPEGLLSHAAGLSDVGFVVSEVWENEAARATFAAGRLAEAFGPAGMPPLLHAFTFPVLPGGPR